MSERNSEFLEHIKRVSDKVDKWPEWKKGEYVNVYEKWVDKQLEDERCKNS